MKKHLRTSTSNSDTYNSSKTGKQSVTPRGIISRANTSFTGHQANEIEKMKRFAQTIQTVRKKKLSA